MVRDIKAEHVSLIGEKIPLSPLWKIGNFYNGRIIIQDASEKIHLPISGLLTLYAGGLNCFFKHGRQCSSGVTKGIKCPCFY